MFRPVADLSSATMTVATFSDASYCGGFAGASSTSVCAPVTGSRPELASAGNSSDGSSDANSAPDQSAAARSGSSDIVRDSPLRGSFTQMNSAWPGAWPSASTGPSSEPRSSIVLPSAIRTTPAIERLAKANEARCTWPSASTARPSNTRRSASNRRAWPSVVR